MPTSQRIYSIHSLRTNWQERDDFIAEVLDGSKDAIRIYIRERIPAYRVEDMVKDASNKFCVGVWRAMLKWNGQGNLREYCAYRGMFYVKEHLRRTCGRHNPSVDFLADSFEWYTDKSNPSYKENRMRALQPSVEEIVTSTETVDSFLEQLAPRDRVVVELVLEGQSGPIVLKCVCQGRHSLTRDIAAAMQISMSTAEKYLISIRKVLRRFVGAV